MVYKNCRISGEREVILDFGELMKVQLKNDRVQSCDTRWDEVVLLWVTDVDTSYWKVQKRFSSTIEKNSDDASFQPRNRT